MRRFIWILIVLIFSVWLGLLIAKDPGLAFFSYRDWSVEMPLWFALLSLILGLFLLYSIIQLCHWTGMLIYRWKSWIKRHQKNKSYSKTVKGVIEGLEGRWKNAEYYLKEGLTQSDAPFANYIILAKSAHEQKAFDRRDMYLRKAHSVAPQADIAISLTQAQFELQQGQLEKALATLNHLRSIAPHHPLVLKLLERVYVHLGDWQHLLKIVPYLYKNRLLTSAETEALEVKTTVELLKLTIHQPNHLAALNDTWLTIPKKVKKHPIVLFYYVNPLIQQNTYPAEDIEKQIYQLLKKQWDKPLARLLGLIKSKDSKKQLDHAEKLLKYYDQQATLLLTLGRLAVYCQLWGKARSYFEKSLGLGPCQETYLEYGKLLEQLGNTASALEIYREGLTIQPGPSS